MLRVALAVFFLLAPASALCQATSFLTQWQAREPWGLAIDDYGNAYVGVWFNQIQKFNPNGTLASGWSAMGGRFAVATDGASRVYVPGDDAIRVFGMNGAYLTQWGSPGQFLHPRGIAVDGAGFVYVASYGLARIQKFTSAGAFVTQWGEPGSGPGQFDRLWGLAIDAQGYVYAADQHNHRIQKFTDTGTYVGELGGYGYSPGQLEYPTAVAVDDAGFVYVSEYIGCRISVFSNTGDFITRWGGVGTNPGQFSNPTGVAVDGSGNLHVADLYNARIQVFGPGLTTARGTTWGRLKALYR